MGWWTIPAETIVSLVYLGFMAVGVDMGRPFKGGLGRLDVGGLVEDLKRQIEETAQTPVCWTLLSEGNQLTVQGGRERIRSLVRPQLIDAARDSSMIIPPHHAGVSSLIDLEGQGIQNSAATPTDTGRSPSRSSSGP
jgi:hypothetical protein